MKLADKTRFPIVGIGASAGGLEALELFLRNVPPASGMAFVIVQHLDPTHDAMLVELLQRVTAMPVAQVSDRMRVEPDHVYVIPPNKDLSLLKGALHLFDPVAARGLRLPIDFFFRSLALSAEERAIAVILSGMGSDGTLGLKAIKEKAGISFVQEPTSAKFDGMPRSAIDSGMADVVAPVEAIPGRIIAYRKHPAIAAPIPASAGRLEGDEARRMLEKVVILLRAHTGHDFSLYKENTIYRRIERRMGIHQIERVATYVRFLQENPQEVELLFKELLIGVTNFFRDPPSWELLKTHIMLELLKDRVPSQPVRAWVAGCATGEEAYSLAILFREAMDELTPPRNYSLQIFATDLDRDAIDKARIGIFPAGIAAEVSEDRLKRHFMALENGGFLINKSIRESVIFAPHNVSMDPPFTKLDLITCRNLLIYLTPELQNKLLPLFHYSLNPRGLLFLGSSETVGSASELFAPLDAKSRIYKRREINPRALAIEFPTPFSPAKSGPLQPQPQRPRASLQSEAEQLLLNQFAPAAVLTDPKGEILFISGRTGKFLEPAAGKTNWNIFAMAREGLRYELTDSFRKAVNTNETVTRRGITVGTNGGRQDIDLLVQLVREPELLRGLVMIVFTEVATPAERLTLHTSPEHEGSRSTLAAQDLAHVRFELQAAREEMQSSKEELNSANEELQSTNEELQSTNEELTTSKEEMQSMNEELQTLNYELQSRVDNLSRLANDMKNLLDSTEVATVFLDRELHVRLFTTGSNQIFRLVATDVGRPLSDLASQLDYPALVQHAAEVLRSLTVHDQPASARDGRWFQVRIMPYRTLDNKIDGVVITFTDITASKNLEEKLRATQVGLEKHIETQALQLEKAERDRPVGPVS